MIERFEGTNRPALVAALHLQRFVQNRSEIAEDLIAGGELLEFSGSEALIVQDDGKNDVFLLVAGTVTVVVKGVEIRSLKAGDRRSTGLRMSPCDD